MKISTHISAYFSVFFVNWDFWPCIIWTYCDQNFCQQMFKNKYWIFDRNMKGNIQVCLRKSSLLLYYTNYLPIVYNFVSGLTCKKPVAPKTLLKSQALIGWFMQFYNFCVQHPSDCHLNRWWTCIGWQIWSIETFKLTLFHSWYLGCLRETWGGSAWIRYH